MLVILAFCRICSSQSHQLACTAIACSMQTVPAPLALVLAVSCVSSSFHTMDCRVCCSDMQQPKPKPKPALKKTNQNFGAYKVPLKSRPASGQSTTASSAEKPPAAPLAAAQPRHRRSSGRSSQQQDQSADRGSSPEVPASRRHFRSSSSKGSRRRRSSNQANNSDSDASTAGTSRPASAAVSVASSAGTAVSVPTGNDDNREATAESILGLWDVNRAQEKTAEKEVVRERRHRASQEGYQQPPPEVPSVDAILQQRLSVSKWKGAVKAVGAVYKMGLLVKNRPPSAPPLAKRGHSGDTAVGNAYQHLLNDIACSLTLQSQLRTWPEVSKIQSGVASHAKSR